MSEPFVTTPLRLRAFAVRYSPRDRTNQETGSETRKMARNRPDSRVADMATETKACRKRSTIGGSNIRTTAKMESTKNRDDPTIFLTRYFEFTDAV
jgi:hypothetical protein